MDDRFLEKFRKKPRLEFTRQLYEKLRRQDDARRARIQAFPSRMLVQGVVAFGLVAVFTLLMVMPGALAGSLRPNVHYLSGAVLHETDRLGSLVNLSDASLRAKVVPVASLQDARRMAGFQVSSPSWTPPNMVLESTLRMAGVQEYNDVDRTAVLGKEIYIAPYAVGMTWRDTRSPRRIQLWIVRSDYWFEPLPPDQIGKGSFEEIEINGLPGGLIQGQWNTKTNRWDYSRGGYLFWTAGGMRYYLIMTGGRLAEADLIQMADSIK